MRSGGILIATLLLLGAIAHAQTGGSVPPATVADDGPAWLEYRLTQRVLNGGGAYEDWSDRLEAVGRYEIGASSVRARYEWHYRSPSDDRRDEENRRVSFDPASRLYTGRPIDLDDYDDHPAGEPLHIWWRIPTDLEVGTPVHILEELFMVEGRVPGTPETQGRETIRVSLVGGAGEREDAYGSFRTTYTDSYWFDAETGWFLREERDEHDIGTYEGDSAWFDVSEVVEVTAASFVPGTVSSYEAERARLGETGGTPGFSGSWSDSDIEYEGPSFAERAFPYVLGGGAFALIVWFVMRRRSIHDYAGKLRRLQAGQSLPSDLAALSPFFGEMIPHLVKQALPIGPVVVAEGGAGVEGLALAAPSGEAATIFARSTECCEALRREIDSTHFFSEVRHDHSVATRAAASQHNVTLTGNHAYNVLETHELLQLKPIPEGVSYDRQVVRRATAADLDAIVQVADAVYAGSNRAWIETTLKVGDVVLVATDKDVPSSPVIGFAIVSVAGATARFSGLTVASGHHGKGLGKELNRARVRVAHDLGAERAIVEVAAWNTASLEIARATGFEKVGSMYVETAAGTPSTQKFRRR